MSVRGARRRQPSQSSLRDQQKKVLNVLIRSFYRHNRIGDCGTSDVAMMGIRLGQTPNLMLPSKTRWETSVC